MKSNRDDVVWDFQHSSLATRVEQFIEDYNAEVDRYKRAGHPADIDSFVNYDRIKWSETLKRSLARGQYVKFSATKGLSRNNVHN